MPNDTKADKGKYECNIRFVVRTDDDSAAVVHDKTGDIGHASFREWVVKTEWWALHNKHTVHKYPA